MTGSEPAMFSFGAPAASGSRQQLSEEVAYYVIEMIFAGKVKQGDFLRLEPIAEALGVSNTPVREGLLSLRAEGFVELVPRRGFMVASFTPQDVKDIFWVQAMIGSELAARAASRITAEQLSRLTEVQERHHKAVEDGDAAAVGRLGHEFHRIINLAADSPRLATLMGATARYVPNRFYATIDAQVQSTLHAHPEIMTALQDGNSRSARSLMRQHILVGADSVIDDLGRHGVWSDAGEAAS